MVSTGTSNALSVLQKAYQDRQNEALKDYYAFLEFPSVSSEPAYQPHMLACAKWVEDYLKVMGFEVDEWQTSGHPVIFASDMRAGPSQPTLLIYNHYDVQPVDPIELWKSPPFEPTLRDGEVFARGAQDNKGQCFYVLFALKLLIDLYGSLPINVKLCIEGEEECGSAGLSGILREKSSALQADYLAIVDLGFKRANCPAVTLGTRGLVTMDVEVSGSNGDLHSGSHGGVAFNPIHALVQMLSLLRDSEGKIAIPCFYENVQAFSSEEKACVNLNFDPAQYLAMFGAHSNGGELAFSPLERNWIRPTIEINGINGGYTGSGFKTVIPAKAHAKLSCRLVPGQDPQIIGNLVAEFLKKQAPEGMKVRVDVHQGSGKAMRTDSASKAVLAFAQVYQEVFGVPCEYKYSGASIPIVPELGASSGAEVVMVGLGLPDDAIHAPNEHFGLDRIEKGVLSIARVLQRLHQ